MLLLSLSGNILIQLDYRRYIMPQYASYNVNPLEAVIYIPKVEHNFRLAWLRKKTKLSSSEQKEKAKLEYEYGEVTV